MENRRAIILSVICFTVSIVLIMGYLSVKRSELTQGFGEEVTVIAADKFIPEYGIIRPEYLKEIKVFKKFRQPQTVSNAEDIVGKSAFISIYPGEQITLTKLVTHEGKPVLDKQLQKSTRAVTVPITPRNSVSKLIRPGNRVDVLIAANYEKEEQNIFEVKTLFQNVLVLATGKHIQNAVPTRVDKDVMTAITEKMTEAERKDVGGGLENLSTHRPADDYNTLTLQLMPEEAEKLIFFMNRYGDSKINFTLRNNTDQGLLGIPTTLLDDLLGPESDYGNSKRKPPPPAPPAAPKYFDLRGGDQIEVY
jgi:pilus assembly protein CpaB